nr:MAG TPA: hypothetical protein [Caudoviricetes sp.]
MFDKPTYLANENTILSLNFFLFQPFSSPSFHAVSKIFL